MGTKQLESVRFLRRCGAGILQPKKMTAERIGEPFLQPIPRRQATLQQHRRQDCRKYRNDVWGRFRPIAVAHQVSGKRNQASPHARQELAIFDAKAALIDEKSLSRLNAELRELDK